MVPNLETSLHNPHLSAEARLDAVSSPGVGVRKGILDFPDGIVVLVNLGAVVG